MVMVTDQGSLLEVVEMVYAPPVISDSWGVPEISPVNVLSVRPEGKAGVIETELGTRPVIIGTTLEVEPTSNWIRTSP